MSAALFAVNIITFVAVAEERGTCSSRKSVEFIQIKEKCLGSPLQMRSSWFFCELLKYFISSQLHKWASNFPNNKQ